MGGFFVIWSFTSTFSTSWGELLGRGYGLSTISGSTDLALRCMIPHIILYPRAPSGLQCIGFSRVFFVEGFYLVRSMDILHQFPGVILKTRPFPTHEISESTPTDSDIKVSWGIYTHHGLEHLPVQHGGWEH